MLILLLRRSSAPLPDRDVVGSGAGSAGGAGLGISARRRRRPFVA